MTMAKKTKKAKKKTPSKLPAVPKTPVWAISPDEQIVGAVLLGKVRKYDPAEGAMTLVLEAPLSVGDSIRVKGSSTDLTQKVERLVVGKQAVQSAIAGETALLAVADRVREGDAVYKL